MDRLLRLYEVQRIQISNDSTYHLDGCGWIWFQWNVCFMQVFMQEILQNWAWRQPLGKFGSLSRTVVVLLVAPSKQSRRKIIVPSLLETRNIHALRLVLWFFHENISIPWIFNAGVCPSQRGKQLDLLKRGLLCCPKPFLKGTLSCCKSKLRKTNI